MKVLADAETQRMVGAAVLGVGGDQVIHSILDVMYAKPPYCSVLELTGQSFVLLLRRG